MRPGAAIGVFLLSLFVYDQRTRTEELDREIQGSSNEVRVLFTEDRFDFVEFRQENLPGIAVITLNRPGFGVG